MWLISIILQLTVISLRLIPVAFKKNTFIGETGLAFGDTTERPEEIEVGTLSLFDAESQRIYDVMVELLSNITKCFTP